MRVYSMVFRCGSRACVRYSVVRSRLVDVVCAVLGLLVYSQFSINYLVRNPAGTLNTRKMSSSFYEEEGRKVAFVCSRLCVSK